MNLRSLILAVAALIIAVVTALMARALMSGNDETPPATAFREVAETKVLVAARTLPAGRILQTEDLKWQPWPESAIDDSYVRDGTPLGEMTGKVLRSAFLAGQPITRDAVVGPNDRGFLAAVLTPGMRAITVSISQTSGVAGFIFPGDRVDLVVTHEVERGDGPRLDVSETVIRNVRVLAIDQNTTNEDNKPKPGGTATLEVTPKQVEKINIMEQLGNLSLSLRPLADTEDTVDADGRVRPALPSDHAPSFTTASEVTRFVNARSSSGGGGAKASPPRTRGVVVVRGNQASMAETGAK